MYKEIVTAMNHPDLKRIWAEQGADPGGMPPAEMEKLVKSEIAKWAKVVKDAGARVDNKARRFPRSVAEPYRKHPS